MFRQLPSINVSLSDQACMIEYLSSLLVHLSSFMITNPSSLRYSISALNMVTNFRVSSDSFSNLIKMSR